MLVFAKVVELRSFSLTAHRLGISRSAASKHVPRLEQALGARLLNRTTRKLSLTEPGHAAYAHCARIAAEVEASELSVQRFVAVRRGCCASARRRRSDGCTWCRSFRNISPAIPMSRSTSF